MSSKLKLTFRPVPIAPVPNLAGTGLPKTVDQVAQDLKSRVGATSVKDVKQGHKGDPFVVVDAAQIVEVLKFLRDDERYLCTALQVVSAVDYPPGGVAEAAAAAAVEGEQKGAIDAATNKEIEQIKASAAKPAPTDKGRMEVVYPLWSYVHRHQITIKAYLDRDNPRIPTVCDLFRCANWFERECYDMLGIIFENHPDLKRILLPEDWVGHPLRRDYVFPEEYNGMKVPL